MKRDQTMGACAAVSMLMSKSVRFRSKYFQNKMKMNETNKAEHVIMTLLSFKQQLAWERLKKEIGDKALRWIVHFSQINSKLSGTLRQENCVFDIYLILTFLPGWEIEMSHCKIHIDTVHDHDQGSYSLLLDWEGRERVKTYED